MTELEDARYIAIGKDDVLVISSQKLPSKEARESMSQVFENLGIKVLVVDPNFKIEGVIVRENIGE
jgi:hypothetical protein